MISNGNNENPPIKSTLNLAINYITNIEKTDEQILISTNKCHTASTHTQFLRRRKADNVRGSVLARHLIQSFLLGEATPEMAYQIGLELCNRMLKYEYEFILSTHINKGHIHNHIIFNKVNMVTGKRYQSNKRRYHQIRYQTINFAKKIAYQALMNNTKDLRRSIRRKVNPGMKMSKLRMALLGTASFSLTLTE